MLGDKWVKPDLKEMIHLADQFRIPSFIRCVEYAWELENKLKYSIPGDQKMIFKNRYIKVLRKEIKRLRKNRKIRCYHYFIGEPGPGDAFLECLKCGELNG